MITKHGEDVEYFAEEADDGTFLMTFEDWT
jgi:hypothetical protein